MSRGGECEYGVIEREGGREREKEGREGERGGGEREGERERRKEREEECGCVCEIGKVGYPKPQLTTGLPSCTVRHVYVYVRV